MAAALSFFNLDDVFDSSSTSTISCSSSASASASSIPALSSSLFSSSSFLNDSTVNSANSSYRKGSTDFFSSSTSSSDPLSFLSSFSASSVASSSTTSLDSSTLHSPPSISSSPSSPSHSASDSEFDSTESWDFADSDRGQTSSSSTSSTTTTAAPSNQSPGELAASLATLLSNSVTQSSTDPSNNTTALLALLESLSNQCSSDEELKTLLSSSLAANMNMNRFAAVAYPPSSSSTIGSTATTTTAAGPLPTPLAFSKSVSNELNLQLLQQETPQSFLYPQQRFLQVNRRPAPMAHAVPMGFLPNGYIPSALLAAAYPVIPNYPYGAPGAYPLPFPTAGMPNMTVSAMPTTSMLVPSSSSSSSTSSSTASSTTVTPKTSGDKDEISKEDSTATTDDDDEEEEKQLLQTANQNARALQQQQTQAAYAAATTAAYSAHLLHPALAAHGVAPSFHHAASGVPSPAPSAITFSASLFPHDSLPYTMGVPLQLNPSLMSMSVPVPSAMQHAPISSKDMMQYSTMAQQDKKHKRRKEEHGDSSDDESGSGDDDDDSDAPAKSARASGSTRRTSTDDETRKWITRTFFNSRVQREVEVVKRSRATGKATIVVESKKIKRREAARKCPRCEDFQAFIRHVIKTPSNRRGIDLTMVPHTCRQYEIALNSSASTASATATSPTATSSPSASASSSTTPPSSTLLPLPTACRIPVSQEMVRPPQNGDVLCELDMRLPEPVGFRHFSFHALFHSASFMRRLNGSDQTKSRISYYAKFLTFCFSENEEYVVWFEDMDGKPTECSWSVEQEFVSVSDDAAHNSSTNASLEPAFHSVVAFNWTHERPKPLLKVARLPPHVSASAPSPVWFQQTATARGELKIVDVKLEKKKKFVQKKGMEGTKSHTPIMIRRKKNADKRRDEEDSGEDDEEEDDEKDRKSKARKQKNKKRKVVKAEEEEADDEDDMEEDKREEQHNAMKEEKVEHQVKVLVNGNSNGNGAVHAANTKTEH